MLKQSDDVAVVVLSWEDSELTAEALRSLAASTDLGLRVIVVDNGSSHGIADELTNLCSRYGADYVRSDRNLGYAGGMNLGLSHVHEKFVLMANNDLRFGRGAVKAMVQALENDPMLGLVSPTVRDLTGAVVSSEWGNFLTSRRALGRIVGLDLLKPQYKLVQAGGEGDWLAGPCFAMRTTDVRRLGLIPERTFMYSEDMRICHSVRVAGMDIQVLRDAEVVHQDEASAVRKWDAASIVQRKTAAYLQASCDFEPTRKWLITLSFQWRTALRFLLRPGTASRAMLRGAYQGFPDA